MTLPTDRLAAGIWPEIIRFKHSEMLIRMNISQKIYSSIDMILRRNNNEDFPDITSELIDHD